MRKFAAASATLCLVLLAIMIACQIAKSANGQNALLSLEESNVVSYVNGTNVYNYALELEKIALNHSLSGYAFRSAGSPGADETAKWIQSKFESFGLTASLEPFEFTTWNLLSQPSLVIDDDGNANTTEDQTVIESFQSTHFSWPTPEDGVFSDIVILPLPDARNIAGVRRASGYDAAAWNATNTKGKIVLTGREVRSSGFLQQIFFSKLRSQPPTAVIFTWWYDWMNFTPPMFASIGGLPASSFGSYFWDYKIPVGWVNHDDGMFIRNKEQNFNISAHFTIQASTGQGVHYNVVGRLAGSVDPEKTIIISSHYDTVMCAGFCDNSAGTAAVIELARLFSEAAKDKTYVPRCTILFIAFTAEELGLVGSTNYLIQHEAELKNIKAVINIDCIGNELLEISETFPSDDGLDLDEIAMKAANDLDVKVNLTEAGGSDQETFRNPAGTNFVSRLFWGIDAGISNATRVKSSIMLCSRPLFYNDQWEMGKAGWIHTEYDNSTSTATFGWVEAGKLESHVQVTALTLIRVVSQIYSPFYLQVLGVTAVASVLAIAAIYVERSRVRIAAKNVRTEMGRYIGMKEIVYMIILTVILVFLCFALGSNVTRVEVDVEGFPTVVTGSNFGVPFQMFQILYNVEGSTVELSEGMPGLIAEYGGGMTVLWQGFILNLALCFLLAFAVTYLTTKLRS